MSSSANSIFHFTPKYNYLDSLLKGTFNISYCLEEIRLGDNEYQVGIPMVSFCNIPLNQLHNHIKSYGTYGIGFNKKWAKQNKIAPVFYVQQNAPTAQLIEHFIRNMFEHELPESSVTTQHLKKAIQAENNDMLKIEATHALLAYVKNYEGILQRKEKIINSNYRYYDEREWRFVPQEYRLKGKAKMLLSKKEYLDWRGNMNKEKPILSEVVLAFKAKDINYIIVKDELEMNRLLVSLKNNNSLFEAKKDYQETIGKIILSKRIKSNFL